MGWTSYPATCWKKGKIDRKAECRKEFGRYYNILKDSMVGSVYYAALQRKDDVNSVIFPLVALTSVQDWEFYYKDMDGSEGPCYYDCPESILKLVTSHSGSTDEWVEQCRQKRKNKRSLESLLRKAAKEGSELKVTLPFDTNYFSKGDSVILSFESNNRWMVKYSTVAFPIRFLRKIGIENIEIIKKEVK